MYMLCNKLGCKIGVKSVLYPTEPIIQATLLKLAAVYLRKDILLREYIVQIPMVTVLLLRTNV
jgi:hypothetical protein